MRRQSRRKLALAACLACLMAGLAAAPVQAAVVELEWDPNSEPDLAGYHVYRSQTSGSGYSRLTSNPVTETIYDDTTAGDNQTYYYVVTAINTAGLESGFSNQVSVTTGSSNQPPLAADDSAVIAEDTSANIDVLSNDSDPDADPLSVDSFSQPSHGSVSANPDDTLSYHPQANYHGSDSFTYTVSDGQGGSAQASVSVTVQSVNDAPVAVADSASTDEDAPVVVAVLSNDSDVDGDILLIASTTQGVHGSVAVNPDKTVTYTPEAGYSGSDSFSYTVSDGHGGSDTATVSVSVSAVNGNPIPVDDSASTDEDVPVVIDVLSNDSDPDGDPLTVSQMTQGAHGSVSQSGGGAVTYTPSADYNGSDSFSYTVSDGQGGTAQASVSVTVHSVNDPPVAVDDTTSTDSGVARDVNVLSNDSDPDGDALSVSSFTQGQHGSTSLNANGTIQYTPEQDFSGTDAFEYTASDPSGASATATVSVSVALSNGVPVAVDDAAQTQEDTSAAISVLANDSDPDGDPLTVSHVAQPQHGAASVGVGGVVNYEPDPDYHGSDSFGYTISDGNGGTAQATVTVTVQSVNDAPLAVDDAVTVPTGSSVTAHVLENDSDPDGDPLSVVESSQGAHGSVSLNADGSLTYTPDEGFAGNDSFSYAVSDGQASAAAAVAVSVTPLNSPPVAVSDSAATDEDVSMEIAVLANDSDPDGDDLSVSQLGQARHGAVQLNGNGTVSYSPHKDFNGSDRFTYTVSDEAGAEDTTEVNLTIRPVNDPPEVDAGRNRTVKPQRMVTLEGSAVDPDGDELSFQWRQLSGATVDLQDSDQPTAHFISPDQRDKLRFELTVSDGQVDSRDHVNIKVNGGKGRVIFPGQVEATSRKRQGGLFVGAAILNPRLEEEELTLTGLDRSGGMVAEIQGEVLLPLQQKAFVTNELGESLGRSALLVADGQQGEVQGFFMIGENSLQSLDGIGGFLEPAEDLYVTLLDQGEQERAILYFFNPDPEEGADLELKVVGPQGRLVHGTSVHLQPSGLLRASMEDLLGEEQTLEKGYLRVQSDPPVQGFQVHLGRDSLVTLPALPALPASRLLVPHFFVDDEGGSTVLRLVNAGSQIATLRIHAFDDLRNPLGQSQATIAPGELLVFDLSLLQGLSQGTKSGYLELDVSSISGAEAEVIGTVTFSGGGGKTQASLPIVREFEQEQVFLQVAQSLEVGMFTGLAVLNPHDETVSVRVEAFDENGLKTGHKAFQLPPLNRRVDLLNGQGYFGPQFSQVRGHFRVSSSRPVAAFALFGDFRREFLAAIESQSALETVSGEVTPEQE